MEDLFFVVTSAAPPSPAAGEPGASGARTGAEGQPSSGRPAPGVLTLVEPRSRRGKPPRHLADLTPGERADAVAGLGEKRFRARQLSVHYFERLVDEPAAMTDLPAASREKLVAALLPRLATPVRRLDCDGGTTVKTVWRLHDGAGRADRPGHR